MDVHPLHPHSHPELVAGDPSSIVRVRIILQRLLQVQLALHGCCLAVLLLGVGTLEEAQRDSCWLLVQHSLKCSQML